MPGDAGSGVVGLGFGIWDLGFRVEHGHKARGSLYCVRGRFPGNPLLCRVSWDVPSYTKSSFIGIIVPPIVIPIQDRS